MLLSPSTRFSSPFDLEHFLRARCVDSHLFISPSISLSPSHSLSLLSLSLYLSIYLFIYLPSSLPVSLPLSRPLSLSLFLPHFQLLLFRTTLRVPLFYPVTWFSSAIIDLLFSLSLSLSLSLSPSLFLSLPLSLSPLSLSLSLSLSLYHSFSEYITIPAFSLSLSAFFASLSLLVFHFLFSQVESVAYFSSLSGCRFFPLFILSLSLSLSPSLPPTAAFLVSVVLILETRVCESVLVFIFEHPYLTLFPGQVPSFSI